MNHAKREQRGGTHRLSVRGVALIVFTMFVFGGALAVHPAAATEIIPSYGFAKSVDGDEAKGIFGLAFRGTLIPNILQTEIGANYRSEEVADGALEIRQWPIMASVLVTPFNLVHADAGVGWYHTTYDYEDDLLDDETDQAFGVHLGGGLKVPLAPRLGLDLTGRYIMMRDQETKLIPDEFDPDFWTLQAGLAIKL